MNKKSLIICIILVCILCLSTTLACDYEEDIVMPVIETDIDFSDKTYVALGDSITYGLDGMKDGKRMGFPYPELVKKQLTLKQAINYGISGSTLSANSIYNFEPMSIRYVEMVDADIISVLGGVNDYLNNVPLGTLTDTGKNTIYGSLNVLCEGLSLKYPSSFIFFMTPFKLINHSTNDLGYSLEDVAKAVKEVCEIYNIPVLDLYNFGLYELEAQNPKSDKLHPSQQFFVEYTSPQISRFIADYYDK